MAQLIKALLDRQVSLSVINSTSIVNKAFELHKTSPVATAGLGRTLTMCSILGTTLKNKNDSMTVVINGGGELGRITVTAHRNGDVKGYVDNPDCTTYSNSEDKLDVSRAVGTNGKLVLIKDMGLKEPYVGTSPIVSGEIAEDFANYFYNSEQVFSIVSLGVLVGTNGKCINSAGVFLQVLPYCEKETFEKLERVVEKLSNVSSKIKRGKIKDFIEAVFSEFKIEYTEDLITKYKCDCKRSKIERVLITLGEAEINDIIQTQGEAEVVCDFCNKKYTFSKDDLTQIIESCKKGRNEHTEKH